MLFDRFLVEAATVSVLGIWILRFNLIWRLCFYGLLLLYCTLTAVQIYSFYLGGEYLTPLAIENINHIKLLIDSSTVGILAFALFLFATFIFILERYTKPIFSTSSISAISIIILISCLSFSFSTQWLPKVIIEQRQKIARKNLIEYTSPIVALYQTFGGKGKNEIQEKFRGLLPSELYFLEKQGYKFNQDDPYPLVKDYIYKGPLVIGEVGRTTHPNVIVFFTEGISTNLLNPYEPDLVEITPHLSDFSESAMRIDNYYGHTWATYRGLLGQLCSIYPYYGGYGGWHSFYDKIVKPPYNCLNMVLNSEGYHTIFLDSHVHDHAYVDEMMGHIGFDEIVTGDQLSSRYLGGENPMRSDTISDLQFYRSFIQFLKNKEQGKSEQNKPFFIGIYTLGTHAFVDMADDGQAFGDGSNPVLNRIHSLDKAFGVFWNYFRNSPLATKTIVIFSSDHAAYMEKPYLDAMEAVGTKPPNPSFLDTIPLIIYDPTRELPKTYDAKVKTAVDFAPSLLHYLEIPNRKNAFVGESIFEKDEFRKRQYGVVVGDKLMLVDQDGEYYTPKDKKDLESTYEVFDKYARGVKHYEMRSRVWPEGHPQ